MSTTSLFVEIIVAGVQATLWILLLLLTVNADLSPALAFLYKYGDYSALFTTIALSLVYMLGILVDRLADTVCMFLYSKEEKKKAKGIGKTRLRVLHASESMAKFLDYQRSRIRITRATVFNLTMLMIVGVFWIIAHRENLPYFLIPSYSAGLICLAISIYVLRRIDEAHQDRLKDAMEIVRDTVGGNFMSKPVVAAICYRHKGDDIEFLLVRTKNGKYWTFPKGHVKQKKPEKPWEAAKREAREEAGAVGIVEVRPLTSYAYPKAKAEEDNVSAYLMEVNEQVRPLETKRDPSWFSAEDAIEKLASGGRKAKYINEHARVVNASVARLRR